MRGSLDKMKGSARFIDSSLSLIIGFIFETQSISFKGKIQTDLYNFPHVEKQKKVDAEWPAYITDNPFYP